MSKGKSNRELEDVKLYEDEKRGLSEKKRVLLIGCDRGLGRESVSDHLQELESLAATFGFLSVHSEVVPLRSVDPATFLKKGKIEELRGLIQEHNVEVVIFDDEITPNQQKNLEKIFRLPVIDRTELILEMI